jgi:hypothetical protein
LANEKQSFIGATRHIDVTSLASRDLALNGKKILEHAYMVKN